MKEVCRNTQTRGKLLANMLSFRREHLEFGNLSNFKQPGQHSWGFEWEAKWKLEKQDNEIKIQASSNFFRLHTKAKRETKITLSKFRKFPNRKNETWKFLLKNLRKCCHDVNFLSIDNNPTDQVFRLLRGFFFIFIRCKRINLYFPINFEILSLKFRVGAWMIYIHRISICFWIVNSNFSWWIFKVASFGRWKWKIWRTIRAKGFALHAEGCWSSWKIHGTSKILSMRHIKLVIRIYPKWCYQYHGGRKSREITVTSDHFRFDDKSDEDARFSHSAE